MFKKFCFLKKKGLIGVCLLLFNLSAQNRILEQLGFNVVCPTDSFHDTEPVTQPENLSAPSCCHFEPYKMHLMDKFMHGTAVQTVAWYIDNPTQTYLAAIGGYKSYINGGIEGVSMRVLQLLPKDDTLQEIDSFLPSDCIHSLDWCSIKGIPYLVLCGIPNHKTKYDTFICSYQSGALIPMAWFSHGATVFSVAWLPEPSNQTSTRYLAIAGDPHNNIDTRILKFDPEQPIESRLTIQANARHGNTVYSLSWLTNHQEKPILATGGSTTHSGNSSKNINIYFFEPPHTLQVLSSAYHEGGIVRTVSWLNEQYIKNKDLSLLLVGGDPSWLPTSKNINTQIFSFDFKKSTQLVSFTQDQHLGKALAANWIPGCHGRYCSAAGLTENFGTSTSCLLIYELINEEKPVLEIKSTITHDIVINTASFALIGSCYYILIGAESENWLADFSNLPSSFYELYLYKGRILKDSKMKNNNNSIY